MTTSLHHYPVLPNLPAPVGAYSHAVRVGNQLWSCGLGPHDPVTNEVPEGIEAQTNQVIDNLETLLNGCGASLADVVRLRVHLADLGRDFATYDRTCSQRFTRPFPVRTTVGSELMGFLIEIDAVCHVSDAPDGRD